MDLRIFTEPQQGASYDDLLAVAQAAERLGFSAFFRSDHYLAMGSSDGLPGADRRLDHPGRHRPRDQHHPPRDPDDGVHLPAARGPLAIGVAQVDAMSGGRVELGIGAGLVRRRAHRLRHPVPGPGRALRATGGAAGHRDRSVVGTRRHRLLVRGHPLLAGGQPGAARSRCSGPAPRSSSGGWGPKRTPRLAATYAAEFNLGFASPEDSARQFDLVRDACRAQDREPATLALSVAQVVCCGEHEADIARRAAAIGREVDELRANGLCGTPDEVVDKLGRFAEIGTSRTYLQVLDLADLDHLALLAEEVLPRVAGL